MKEALQRHSAAVFLAALALAFPTGCAPAPRTAEKIGIEKEAPRIEDARESPLFNKAEPLSHHFVLPPAWDGRCSAPERLVGHYLALVPDRKSPTGHRVEVLGPALNDRGTRSVAQKKTGWVRYQGRVEGSFASALSFVPGRLEIRKDALYDLTVADASAFQVAAQSDLLDRRKVGKIWNRLPRKYRDVFFISSAAASTITAREFAPSGGSAAGSAAFRVGETHYREEGAPVVRQALYLTLLSEGGLFGDLDEKTGLYGKKGSFGRVNLKKRGKEGSLVSFQTMQLLRKTLAARGVSGGD